MSHNANVIELIARPAIAHLDLSLNMTTRHITNDTGGTNTIKIPPRNPKIEPHPKPGHLSNCAMTNNQGDTAMYKPALPI
jgi:hypothetical protein